MLFRLNIPCSVLIALGAAVVAADDPAGSAWQFDVVRLKNGSVLRGLILEQTAAGIRFQDVRQKPGRPTVVFFTTITSAEIDEVERLEESERDQLRQRLRDLGPEQSEKQKMGRIELEPCDWAGQPNAGRRYRSDWFVLTSNAQEAVVRRAAVRLEQIYTAFARFLPPRATLARPTAIELIRSRAEYAERLKAEGRTFINTAFYDPATNQIVCTGDLAQLGDKLEAARRESQLQRAEIDQREAKLAKLYKGEDLTRLLQQTRAARAEIAKAERANEGIFDKAAEQLFAVLYHEAFHAYLAGFVYPPGRAEVPRWLNEGLAQIFETALVEAGELRIGHADRQRLSRAKEAIRKGALVPIGQLVHAGAPQFLATHAGDRRASDQFYLTAWAVAHHLTFERRILGSPALDEYCRALAGGADPETAFAGLTGQTTADYEKDLAGFLQRLQPDGSLSAGPEK
jgi:hypothetical protein